MTWDGDFVANALNIQTPDDSVLFKTFLGLALRKNPKRAHLLVSKILGKHVPVIPSNAIGTASSLVHWIRKELADSSKLTVFGYAETATALGANIAHHLSSKYDTVYLHSTRYPVEGAVDYGSFEEEHSHASAHHITPADRMMLDDPERVIILVDDELTTGNTAMNTIRLFESHAHHDQYIIATLTDMRTEEAVKRFKEFEKEIGVRVSVASIISSTGLIVPPDSVQKAAPIIDYLKSFAEPVSGVNGMVTASAHPYTVPSLSLGVDSAGLEMIARTASRVAHEIPLEGDERVLVMGIEEDMFFPMLVAEEIRKQGGVVDFSSTTRSPVIAFDDPAYAIKTRIRYHVEDDQEPRYAYNIHKENYTKVILIMDETTTKKSKKLISRLAEEFENVHIALLKGKTVMLSEPLTGETGFSSYSGDDVKWLLKDVSDAALEAPVEEREEAVQAGEAHYSESLPVEYQPTDEYQKLFHETLTSEKEKLAEIIGIVAEQIFEKRDGKPVLVSLARAGTPVGILIKRYLKAAHGVDVPHYAVSIIRDKGIDRNALNYLAQNYNPQRIIFVDGWTGKGTISTELQKTLSVFYGDTLIDFNRELAVLADPGAFTRIYGTRDDFLIPSACLNSTVSGLVSRTVLNENLIGEHDYHGAKYYSELAGSDVSNLFLDTITAEFTEDLIAFCSAMNASRRAEPATWAGWRVVNALKEEFGIDDRNLIKPGVGETTRVLLRRIPWGILINPAKKDDLKHVLMLAREREVRIIEKPGLPYSCVGIIKPRK